MKSVKIMQEGDQVIGIISAFGTELTLKNLRRQIEDDFKYPLKYIGIMNCGRFANERFAKCQFATVYSPVV